MAPGQHADVWVGQLCRVHGAAWRRPFVGAWEGIAAASSSCAATWEHAACHCRGQGQPPWRRCICPLTPCGPMGCRCGVLHRCTCALACVRAWRPYGRLAGTLRGCHRSSINRFQSDADLPRGLKMSGAVRQGRDVLANMHAAASTWQGCDCWRVPPRADAGLGQIRLQKTPPACMHAIHAGR